MPRAPQRRSAADPRDATRPDPPGATGPAPATEVPDPGWVPRAPTVRPQPDVRVLSPTPRPRSPGDATIEAGEVVVRRGDTLWSIAARHLGPDPSDAEIAQAWPAWHAANREVVGDRSRPAAARARSCRSPEAVAS